MPVTVGGSAITPSQAEQLRVALGVDGEPVTRRLTALTNTVDFIGIDGAGPALVAASVIADYVGAAPAATEPAAFTAGQWTATAGDTQVELNITALPSDGGSAITELRYRTTGSGSGTALSGTGTGVRTITGLTNGVALDFQIAAVNAVGTGAWSDVKSRTPSSSATAPAAFTAGQWDAAATATAGEMQYQITALPSNGGSAITALEYRVGAGAAIALTGTGTGNRTVTAGWTAGTAADTQVRAVNAIGAGAWSDTKNRTPAAGGGGGALTIVRATPYQTTWDTNHTISFPAVASGNSLIIACVGVRDDARVTGSTLDHTGGAHNDGQFVTFRHIDNVTDGRTSVTITTYDAGSPASGGLRAIVLEVNASAIAPASAYAPQETTSTASFSHGFTTTAAGAAAVSLINAPGGPVLTGTGGWTPAWATGEWDNILYTGDLGAAGAKAMTGGLSPSGNVRTNTLAYAAV